MLVLVLHNVRSAHNVGSILRTADGVGVSCVYLCGHTPTPLDRFGRTQTGIAKVALGAQHTVPWEYVADTAVCLERLRSGGVRIVALEQDARAVSYDTYTADGPTALVLGEEVRGVPPEVLKRCDEVIEIPMRGIKHSLNVSVAAGIALYRIAVVHPEI